MARNYHLASGSSKEQFREMTLFMKRPLGLILLTTLLAPQAVFALQHDWLLRGSLVHFDYAEDLAAPLKSQERGFLPQLEWGGLLKWSEAFEAQWMSSHVLSAPTSYDGNDLSTQAPVSVTDRQSFWRPEATLRWFFHPGVALEVGLGWVWWSRTLTYGTGYREQFTWWVLPVGLRLRAGSAAGWNASFFGQLRPTFSPEVRVIYSETVVNGVDSVLSPGAKMGWRLGADFDRPLSSSWGLLLSVWHEASSMGRSNSAYNGTPGLAAQILLPANETQQSFFGLGLRFQH